VCRPARPPTGNNEPVRPRTLARALLATASVSATAALGACGGGDRADGADHGGTLALFEGTLPADGPAARPADDTGAPLVAMVGDSITVGSVAGLRAAAAASGYELVVDAEVGRRITGGTFPRSGTAAVTDLLATAAEPDVWVVALGTNDIGKHDSADGYARDIDTLVGLLPDDVPLVWINVYLPGQPEESAVFNRALIDALAARGRASIGAWTAHADDEGVLSDGVHPTDDGAARFVEVVIGQLESWLE